MTRTPQEIIDSQLEMLAELEELFNQHDRRVAALCEAINTKDDRINQLVNELAKRDTLIKASRCQSPENESQCGDRPWAMGLANPAPVQGTQTADTRWWTAAEALAFFNWSKMSNKEFTDRVQMSDSVPYYWRIKPGGILKPATSAKLNRLAAELNYTRPEHPNNSQGLQWIDPDDENDVEPFLSSAQRKRLRRYKDRWSFAEAIAFQKASGLSLNRFARAVDVDTSTAVGWQTAENPEERFVYPETSKKIDRYAARKHYVKPPRA